MKKSKRVCIDTSVIINGKITKMIKSNKLNNHEIIIPELVMGELQAQASKGRETGYIGLGEIKKIRKLIKKHNIKINFFGERQSYEDILLARSGRIDALIIDVAKENKAVLITSDLLQATIAEIKGLEAKYFRPWKKTKTIKIERFLTKDTMSIHLKEGAIPYAKRGKPGNVKFVQLRKNRMKSEEMEMMITEILESARYGEDSFVEYGEHGASVIQLKDKRISIARPPFSDGIEITLVRPIVKLTLDDYKLSSKLKKRLEERAEGILLAGPPGSGKTTMAASLAEFYFKKGNVVKTLEQPRDLQVPPEITQYAPLNGSFAKTANILLLVRPDYTIFDDIRKHKEFEIFSDMRLSGIGMIGVVHATNPVDAIQRFIGKIELGVIPHIIDTILFIKDGNVEKVYSLGLTVRMPYGMKEEDLARPIVEVRDFETASLEYEIYVYGEQTVVIPVKEKKVTGIQRLASKKIKEIINKFDPSAEIEFTSGDKVIVKVRNEAIPSLIGKDGKTIKSIENKLGVSIDVQPIIESLGKEIKFDIHETGAYVVLSFHKKNSGKISNVYVDKVYLFSATVGRAGKIKISKNSELGKFLLRAMTNKKQINVFV
jgi:ATPase